MSVYGGGSASSGLPWGGGACIQRGMPRGLHPGVDLHRGVWQTPPQKLEKQAVRILLECLLVLAAWGPTSHVSEWSSQMKPICMKNRLRASNN